MDSRCRIVSLARLLALALPGLLAGGIALAAQDVAAQDVAAQAVAAQPVVAPPVTPEGDLRALEEAAVQASVAQVAPSIVRIETLGGLQQVDGTAVSVGPTTGVVLSEDGFIVSSAFGFVQQPTSILVVTGDGQRAAAQIVARDHSRMLVLLKANFDQPLAVAEPVPREAMKVGQWTIAVGRTFAVEELNVSVGVMSATNRIWGKAIQTDAKISPNNYGGALIDIDGRVLGVLAPLSPQGEAAMAGAEWYDSGIGFAVPLVDIQARFDTWKQGQDLHPGLLGIALEGQNDMLDEPVIGVVRVKSPAAAAGLKPKDKIVSANGTPVTRLAELKHILGRLYAGDTLALEIQRGDERISASAPLVAELVPYVHPFLGVLPSRDAAGDQPGIVVRYVYPESPAASAGLVAGDRLLTWNGQNVTDVAATQTLAAQQEAGETITIGWSRGEEKFEKQVVLARLPSEVPESLPAARAANAKFEGERPAVGEVAVKIAEEANECVAWVPDAYDPRAAYGLLVWLHPSGKADAQAAIAAWKAHCEQHDLVLLAPQGVNQQWRPTDVAFIRKTIEYMLNNYQIDRQRIVVHGAEAGGALSYLTAFGHRDLIRGAAPLDVALPARVRVPDNEPLQRLAILTNETEGARSAPAVRKGIEALEKVRFPVTVIKTTTPGELNDEQRALLARWVDTLDRL